MTAVEQLLEDPKATDEDGMRIDDAVVTPYVLRQIQTLGQDCPEDKLGEGRLPYGEKDYDRWLFVICRV